MMGEIMRKRNLLGVVVVAGLAVILAACSSQQSSSSKDQVMKVGTSANIGSANSLKYSDTGSVEAIQNVFEGLYRFNQKGQPVKALAKSVSVNKDKTVYTYTLQHGKWSNGQDVKASDFVYAWQQLGNPKTASPNSQRLDPFKNGYAVRNGKKPVSDLGIKALGKYKLQITLASPITYFPEILTGAPFMPINEAYAKKVGNKYGIDSAHLVSNGPYVLKKWHGTNDTWEYVKNNQYWDKKDVKQNKIDVQVVKSVATGANLFETKKLDYTQLSNEYVSRYQNKSGFHVSKSPSIGYMGFNTKRKVTGNRHARLALALAFDKKALTKQVMKDGSTPLNGIVPANFAYNTKTGTDFRKYSGSLVPYNVKKAQAEWKTAKKQLGIKKANIQLLAADTPEAKQVVEYLQAEYQKNLPGLNVTIHQVPLKQRLQMTSVYNFDFVYGTWAPDYADPINFIGDGGAYHLNTDYKNKTYLKDMANARGKYATEPVKRFAALKDAEKQLVQRDAFTAPVFQGSNAYLLNSKIKGLAVSPYGTTLFYRDVQFK